MAPLNALNKREIVNDEFNCDQTTNGISSAENTSQIKQEEDEDEDRKTNLLLPYNSINSNHNNYGNDDDDDCNSSEDTKTSCPGERVSLQTEQRNEQQQQVCFHWHHLNKITLAYT